jgi:hypothetical protein
MNLKKAYLGYSSLENEKRTLKDIAELISFLEDNSITSVEQMREMMGNLSSYSEMYEGSKEGMRPKGQAWHDTKSDKWDGPRTTTGRKFAKRVSNKKRRAQDKKATKED